MSSHTICHGLIGEPCRICGKPDPIDPKYLDGAYYSELEAAEHEAEAAALASQAEIEENRKAGEYGI